MSIDYKQRHEDLKKSINSDIKKSAHIGDEILREFISDTKSSRSLSDAEYGFIFDSIRLIAINSHRMNKGFFNNKL